ncbi:MAG TPA: kelch repeat-containing protein, partial [Solirubrobacter sp.]
MLEPSMVRSPAGALALLFAAAWLTLAAPARAGVTPGWQPASPPATARSGAAAVLLGDGQVLVVGGRDVYGAALATAERYDPVTDSWGSGGTMSVARETPSATVLPDGRVLVAGGDSPPTLELFDPVSGRWTGAAAMPHSPGTATLLSDGKVLFARDEADLYDPGTKQWTTPGVMGHWHEDGTATLLPSGHVLLAGGSLDAPPDLYDPVGDRFTQTAAMRTPRADHTATLLQDGRALIVGGRTGSVGVASAELYSAGSWTAAASLATPRFDHAASRLATGEVLVSGGTAQSNALSGSELYDPRTDTWRTGGPMRSARRDHVQVALRDGTVLVAGGHGSYNGASLSSAERWTPTTQLAVDGSLGFGAVPVGAASTAALRIRNSGGSPLWLGGIGVSGDFAVIGDTCSTAPVAPGTGCALTVRFAPGAAGERGGTLSFQANTAAGANSVTLGGSGAGATATPTAPAEARAAPPAAAAGLPRLSPTISIPFRAAYAIGRVPKAKGCQGTVTLTLL